MWAEVLARLVISCKSCVVSGKLENSDTFAFFGLDLDFARRRGDVYIYEYLGLLCVFTGRN